MVYEVSSIIRKKLGEIIDIADADEGEWENNEEKHLVESIRNICDELVNFTYSLPVLKKEED